MQILSQQLDFSADAPPLPAGFSDEIYKLCLDITSPEVARQTFDQLQPLLSQYRADGKLAVACGLLAEKRRDGDDMSALWASLHDLCPENELTLRMHMRWYRREGRVEDGLAQLVKLYPDSWYSLTQARRMALGLSELKAWDELDQLMTPVLVLHSHDRAIRMAYIKALAEQARFPDAARIATGVAMPERMGEASRNLLADVTYKARILETLGRSEAAEVIADIFNMAPAPRSFDKAATLIFFSGQLGTGGAERQMTRIASAYQARIDAGQGGPAPQVWVKHANAATGADFYRAPLAEAGVPVRVMSEEPEGTLAGIPDEIAPLLDLLSPDIRHHTLQLTAMFREAETDVAYLWQDGGIVQSAIAAVLAGVPRIVTSFRGLPPNLRPQFFRSEMPVLYAALARLPHVTFTANSKRTAAAYENWLGLPAGTVQVIPNAIPGVAPEGDDSDQNFWFEVQAASEPCDKTVLGVFRFDDNKRPLAWIDAAARYLETADDTRFVMLGDGVLKDRARAHIDRLGLGHRIFLAGIRSNVGFYMHRANLLMHLAQMEGLPNVLIEAQLAGTPVLATPAGGTDEVVADGTTGVLLSDAETLPEAELDAALKDLLSDPDRLARLGAGALTHSGDRFSVDTILDCTVTLFETQSEETS